MTDTGNPSRGNWTGSTAFVLVAAGSAIGLGNIWKFPFITGMNGGGAFVLVYLLCIAIIGLPILAAEMLIGRKGGRGPVTTFATLASKERGGKAWSVFGWMAVITAFILLSYYSVVGGWTIAYAVKTVSGAFSADVVEEIPGMFDAFVTNSTQVVLYHLLFMTVTIVVVIGGVQGGIERAAKILMPALGVLLLILLGRSLVSDGAGKALTFMFYPDFSKLTPAGILEAMGHAFFTLSLGMGAILVYGSYLKKEESILKAAVAVGVLDTVIALAAGVMIFGIVFSFDLEPAAGPSLIFKTMPVLFAQMAGGTFFALLFFLLLAFAALTSAISILEVVVAYVVDHEIMNRKLATLVFGGIIFLIGILSALSFGELEGVKLIGERGIFDSLDYLVSNWSLPLGGLGVTLFAGWALETKVVKDELADDPWSKPLFTAWYALIRYVAPAAVVIVILSSVGFFEWIGLIVR